MGKGARVEAVEKAITRAMVTRDVRRVEYAANVAEAVGPLEHGFEIYGLARGQYSLIDLIEYVLGTIGPAHLVISTWTAAGTDIEYALRLCHDGRVLGVRWLVDSSFPSRQPGYCAALRARFGDDCIRVTKNHAKFVLLGNADWHVVLRTSMNLNENKRLESWELSDDRVFFDYLTEVIERLFEESTVSLDSAKPDSDAWREFTKESEDRIAKTPRIRYVK